MTGERSDLASDLGERVSTIRRYTDLPLVVGFGISSAEHVREVAEHADGVVVGSALVNCISSNLEEPAKISAVIGEKVKDLREGLVPKVSRRNFPDMSDSSGELFFLAGVTASGKTELAITWAQENDAEILSCDSVAFYKGMDIGSSKPSLVDQNKVCHYGLDLSPVNECFDISRFVEYARHVVSQVHASGKKTFGGGRKWFLSTFLFLNPSLMMFP